MKKFFGGLLALLLILTGCQSTTNTSDKLKVVVTFYPLAQFAESIGGEYVEVVNLVPTGEEVHGFELTPKNRADIEESDLFVYNGLSLESWVEDVIATVNELHVVNSSTGVHALEASGDHDHEGEDHDHEEEEEHDHGEYDPHIWLSVKSAKIQLKNILEGLIAVDPDHETQYQANYDIEVAKMDELDEEYTTQLADLQTRQIVTSHQAFAYLAHDYDLEQVAITGINDESEPTAQALIEVIEYIKENQLKVIFVGELVSSKVSEQIASETGAELKVLYTIEGLSSAQETAKEDYFSLMRANLKALVDALSS